MTYGTLAVTEESTATTGATWLRNITIQGEMSSSSGSFGVGVGVGVAGGPTLAAAQQSQGVAALLVMLAVLCFIFAYCCWGAPFCRSLCRRHCCCRLEDPEPDSRFGNSDQTMVATPTIILLPHGRMLVVDGTMFTQFQADPTGLDLVELGDSVLRAQRNPRSINRHQLQNSQGSILEMDAETPSKDSLGSIACFPPPTYESIYGKEETDMPPSYSDILLHRFANLPHELDMHDFCRNDKEEIEMQSLEGCPHIVGNPMNVLTYPYATVTSFSSQSFPRRNVSRNPSIISNPLDNYYMDNDLGLYRLSQEMGHRVSSNTNLSTYRTSHDDITFQLFHENETHQRENLVDNENHRSNSQNVNRNNEQRYAHRVDETTNSTENTATENDIMNTRNRARSISRISNDSNTNRERASRDNDQAGVAFVRHVNSHETETSLDVPHEMCNVNRVNEISQAQLYRGEQSTARNVHFQNTQPNEINQNNEASPNIRYLHRSRRSENESRTQNADSESGYSDDDAGNFGALADIRESRV
ncbi:clustered-asparagine-rich protein-like [Vespula squamosa]|uniref:Clustered-asparagine-rich protein-like n=1 Tax=Vespula squamosa TaxID=30214 RepID=A0ABD2B746_VESSQ